MSKQFRRVGPKRQVARIRTKIVDSSVSSSEENVIVHTALQKETLVRTIIQLNALLIKPAAGASFLDILLELAPGGNSVEGPGLSAVGDDSEGKNALWRYFTHAEHRSDIGVIMPIEIRADIQGMRKLDKDDVVQLSYLGSVAGDWGLTGYIIQFYKLA